MGTHGFEPYLRHDLVDREEDTFPERKPCDGKPLEVPVGQWLAAPSFARDDAVEAGILLAAQIAVKPRLEALLERVGLVGGSDDMKRCLGVERLHGDGGLRELLRMHGLTGSRDSTEFELRGAHVVAAQMFELGDRATVHATMYALNEPEVAHRQSSLLTR